MGVQKKLGISKEQRDTAERYCKRFGIPDHTVILSRASGKRVVYVMCTDDDDIIYKIRFDKIKRMKSPKGVQVVNKLDYLIHQGSVIHGKGAYDYSLIKEEDIKFSTKLPIICSTHGVFYKRKSAHITDGEGCPKCSANRLSNNRQYF